MKTVILVGDGMGDYGLTELGGQTILEAAHTPSMDYLAGHGRMALLRTVPPGMLPGSDVANLSLLGYRAEEFYTGRSPLRPPVSAWISARMRLPSDSTWSTSKRKRAA